MKLLSLLFAIGALLNPVHTYRSVPCEKDQLLILDSCDGSASNISYVRDICPMRCMYSFPDYETLCACLRNGGKLAGRESTRILVNEGILRTVSEDLANSKISYRVLDEISMSFLRPVITRHLNSGDYEDYVLKQQLKFDLKGALRQCAQRQLSASICERVAR